MKLNRIFLLSTIIFIFVSCKYDPTTPTTDGSYIIAEPDTLVLDKTDSTKVTALHLSCGCAFTLQISGTSGDTSAIKFFPTENFDSTLSRHSIQFYYSPSKVTTAPAPVILNLTAHKRIYTYTHSILVKAN